MKLIQVRNSSLEKDFLDVPRVLYANDPKWVCPLDNDIKAVFDPNKNGYFKHGEARRWVLYDENKKLIGRIAAFIDHEANVRAKTKAGGIGFFECINNMEAAYTLFDAAAHWLTRKDIQVIDGPINFGERDRFWGLMIFGFEHPSYLENYNPPYYQEFFESYGFNKFFEQTTSEVSKQSFNYERFKRISERVTGNDAYTFEQFDRKQIDRFSEDFCEIYNAAWERHENFNPMSTETVKDIFKSIMPIVIDNFVWFAYANGEPAGFFINIIEANEIFRHLNGKMHLWNKLRFLYYRSFQKPKRLKGIVFGVKPKFQNIGIETGMIINFYSEVTKWPSMDTFELAWVGDFNPKMQSLLQALGCRTLKIHATYRKVLSGDIEFKKYELKK